MSDATNTTLSVIPEVGLTEIDGQPRARDIDIGERLGFSRPRDIRALIDANIVELEGFGPLARRGAAPLKLKGKPAPEGKEVWLNEEQVLLISAISKAPNAAAVRSMLIRVFVAWRRGHLVSADAFPPELVEYVRRTDGISRMLSHKVTGIEKAQEAIAALLASIVSIVQPPQPVFVRHGKTSGQIWAAHGFPRIKITCWFGNRLAEQGCQMEGKTDFAGRTFRLFDPDKADLWLRNGGRLLVEQKIAERRGQGRLKLVAAD